MWIASGRTRIGMDLADEEYFWKTAPGRDAARLPLGRCLWGGAEADVARILVSEPPEQGPPVWTASPDTGARVVSSRRRIATDPAPTARIARHA